MDTEWLLLLLQSVLWTVQLPTGAAPLPPDTRTALENYVNAVDPHYSYTLLDNFTRTDPDFTRYVLNMTSLQWLNDSVVDRPVWWHYLIVTIPRQITPGLQDSAFLFVDQGDNGPEPPDHLSTTQKLIAAFAVSSGTVSACLSQIPNQPLSFLNDTEGRKSRSEDSLMAYTWWHFLNNHSNDPSWLLLFPMTKACVRGMDTVTDFVLKVSSGVQRIDRFSVSGASKELQQYATVSQGLYHMTLPIHKFQWFLGDDRPIREQRGWAAWLVAAVDSRVMSLAPIVMDLLNISENLHHHFRSYGGWSFAFRSYYEVNITGELDSPNMKLMSSLIDPLAYNEQYRKKPKLIISTGGDEFFLPDDSHYYYDQLEGEKHLRVLPNAEHLCVGHWLSILLSIQSFYLSTMLDLQRPTMHWNRTQSETSGAIYLHTDTPPIKVLAYEAVTMDAKRRDFRWAVVSPVHPSKFVIRPIPWWSSPVSSPSPGVYVKEFPVPKRGWRAFFIEASFSGPLGAVQTFSTEVHVLPDTFPFPQCKAQACHGSLV